jgi:hypothetical protein
MENYLTASSKIDVLSEEKEAFCIDQILNIHRTVMQGLIEKEKIGIFRKKLFMLSTFSLTETKS